MASVQRAALVLLVAGLLAAALLLREPIGRWLFPDAAVAGLLAQADEALARGDVASAAARFQVAQARSPDHPRVAEGLTETRMLALAKAEAELAAGRFDAAGAQLDLAAALGAPGDRITALRHAIEERAEPSVETLLKRALEIEADDPAAALDDFLQVLAREPGNALALAGRGRLLAAMLAEAEAALARGELDLASTLVAKVKGIDPAHLKLPELAQRLGALPMPSPVAPQPMGAPRASSDEARRWLGLAEEALGRGALDEARRALDHARALDAAAPQLVELETRWQRARAGAPASP